MGIYLMRLWHWSFVGKKNWNKLASLFCSLVGDGPRTGQSLGKHFWKGYLAKSRVWLDRCHSLSPVGALGQMSFVTMGNFNGRLSAFVFGSFMIRWCGRNWRLDIGHLHFIVMC